MQKAQSLRNTFENHTRENRTPHGEIHDEFEPRLSEIVAFDPRMRPR
jgi:hypothetical protein